MMDANYPFGTLRCLLIMYTVLFTIVTHYLKTNKTGHDNLHSCVFLKSRFVGKEV